MKKWVYIKTYERVVELHIDEQLHAKIINAWQNDEKLAIKDMNGDPLTLSGKYDIYSENQYDAWVSHNKPNEYLKKGVWLDGKEKGRLRLEPWKQKEQKETPKIEEPIYKGMTPEQWERQKAKMYAMFAQKGINKNGKKIDDDPNLVIPEGYDEELYRHYKFLEKQDGKKV